MIETLPVERLDEARSLRIELHRHHSAIAMPYGYVPRDEDDAWRTWRAKASALLEAGRAELFLHRTAPGVPADGLAFVTMLPTDELVRPVVVGVGVHAELLTLVVAADARGSGLGAVLHDLAARWARDRGATVLHIETRADNVDGLRFYERQGARPAFTQLLQEL